MNYTILTLNRNEVTKVMINYWKFGDEYKKLNVKAQFLNGIELANRIDISSGGKVLDIGCGTADALIYMASKYPQCDFVGVDLSADMLRVAKKYTDVLGITNVKFIEANIEELNLEEQYDAIISNAAFHWLNKELIVKKIVSHLRYNGTLAIYTAGIDEMTSNLLDREEREFLLLINRLELTESYQHYKTFTSRRISPEDMKSLFEMNGLIVQDYGLIIRKVYFEDFEEYLTWLKASGNTWLEPFDKSKKEEIYRTFIKLLKTGKQTSQYFTYHVSSFCFAKKREGEYIEI